uniref:Uncharacterized protein n=1 Tax=Populus trichocarpa TaxID=3694 RepID=B9MW25_POPTR
MLTALEGIRYSSDHAIFIENDKFFNALLFEQSQAEKHMNPNSRMGKDPIVAMISKAPVNGSTEKDGLMYSYYFEAAQNTRPTATNPRLDALHGMEAVTSTNLSSSSTPPSSNESGLNVLSVPSCRSPVDATRSSNQQGKALIISNWLWLIRSHEK